MNLEQRTIEILAQVVFKEAAAHAREAKFDRGTPETRKIFFECIKEDTLELARTILRVNKTINP